MTWSVLGIGERGLLREGLTNLERPDGLKQSKVAILDELARFQACRIRQYLAGESGVES